MKKHLLLTTALVAVFGISNAYAEHTSLGNLVVNDGDTINETSGSEKYYDSITINGGTVNIKNGSEIKTEKTSDVINISGGNISLDEGEIKGHFGNMNITGGTITGTNDTEIGAGITTISGNTVIALSKGASIGADSILNINGGTFNLSDNGLIDAGPYDEYEGIGLIQMTSGTINMEGAHLIAESSSINNVRDAGNIQIKGGTVNVKSGNNIIMTSDNAEVSHVSGSNAILNVSDGANLYVYEKYSRDHGTELFDRFYQKGTLNILDNATINLGGTLNSNVNNAAKFNVTSTSAKLNGNFNVNNNGVVDLGTNKLTVDGNVAFNEGSKLALVFTSKDKVGQIDAKNISINENNTTLDMSFNNPAVANSGVEVQVLNASEEFTGKFAKIAENSEYNIEDKGNGLYAISKKSSAPDEGGDDSGKKDDTPAVIPVADDAGDAWNNLDTGSVKNETTVAVADRLTYLRNHQTTAAGKQAYEDALTALAPETAPAVQQAATEGTNQIFGAVGTRLSGGAIASAKQGMSSGDNPFTKVAVWVQGLFNKAKLDDTSKSKGFDSKTYGTALGVESKISEDVKLGIGYAYSKTDIDGFMRDTDVKTHTAILYGEYKPKNWYVNAIASYGWSDYDEKKNVAGVGVKADWDVEPFALQMMTGYDMYFNGFGVTPEAGLRYIHVKQDKYTDTAGQSVKSDDSDIVTGVLGAKIAKSYNLSNGMLLTPEFKAAMTYDISHDNSKSTVTLVNGSSYSVTGKPLNRFGVELGAGITAELNDNVELSLGYEGKFRKDYQDHTGLINAKYKF